MTRTPRWPSRFGALTGKMAAERSHFAGLDARLLPPDAVERVLCDVEVFLQDAGTALMRAYGLWLATLIGFRAPSRRTWAKRRCGSSVTSCGDPTSSFGTGWLWLPASGPLAARATRALAWVDQRGRHAACAAPGAATSSPSGIATTACCCSTPCARAGAKRPSASAAPCARSFRPFGFGLRHRAPRGGARPPRACGARVEAQVAAHALALAAYPHHPPAGAHASAREPARRHRPGHQRGARYHRGRLAPAVDALPRPRQRRCVFPRTRRAPPGPRKAANGMSTSACVRGASSTISVQDAEPSRPLPRASQATTSTSNGTRCAVSRAAVDRPRGACFVVRDGSELARIRTGAVLVVSACDVGLWAVLPAVRAVVSEERRHGLARRDAGERARRARGGGRAQCHESAARRQPRVRVDARPVRGRRASGPRPDHGYPMVLIVYRDEHLLVLNKPVGIATTAPDERPQPVRPGQEIDPQAERSSIRCHASTRRSPAS